MHEHDGEPVPGLPEELPQGEKMLWQGQANAKSLARGSFHIRKLAIYFAVILALRLIFKVSDGAELSAVFTSLLWLSGVAGIALGIVALFANRSAVASMYTITDRRVVIRCGIAVPVTINLPFKMIDSLDLRLHDDGTGDVAIGLNRTGRASYILLFPMVKPFRLFNVRPVMRGIEHAEEVCRILSAALADFAAKDVARDAQAATLGHSDAAQAEPEREPRRVHLPLLATASFVVLTLVGVTVYQLSTLGQSEQIEAASAMVEVYFEDADDGSVRVLEATSGQLIDTLEPETNGFMRSALRSMVRERRQSDIGAETPFVIRRTVSDRIQLLDPATDRLIDLRAFGPTNAGAFARLLDIVMTSDVKQDEQSEVTELGVASVASNQQERDQ